MHRPIHNRRLEAASRGGPVHHMTLVRALEARKALRLPTISRTSDEDRDAGICRTQDRSSRTTLSRFAARCKFRRSTLGPTSADFERRADGETATVGHSKTSAPWSQTLNVEGSISQKDSAPPFMPPLANIAPSDSGIPALVKVPSPQRTARTFQPVVAKLRPITFPMGSRISSRTKRALPEIQFFAPKGRAARAAAAPPVRQAPPCPPKTQTDGRHSPEERPPWARSSGLRISRVGALPRKGAWGVDVLRLVEVHPPRKAQFFGWGARPV